MPKPSPSLYSIPKTFVWFALVSLLLVGCLVAIVISDYNREWKTWQTKFIQLKLKKTKAQLQQAAEKVDPAKLAQLTRDHQKTQERLAAQKTRIRTLQQEIHALDTRTVKLKIKLQDLKQYQDSYKYFYEEKKARQDPEAAQYAAKLARLLPQMDPIQTELEQTQKQLEEKQKTLDDFFAEEKTIEKETAKILEEKNRLEQGLKNLEPSLAKTILNAPMVDFLAPTLEIQQVVLENLYDDYHFAKTHKVDRCTTCHLGIDQKGFEDAPQPFRTHPKLGLFVGASSAHPVEKFGCTVCHGGSGHSVSFKDSAHTPQNETQKNQWEAKHSWRRLEKWEEKMLPLNHIQASCAKCHREAFRIPEADTLNTGRKLAQVYGCIGCHKIEGFSATEHGGRWKTGPDLTRIQSKLTDDWIRRWLHDPKNFRPSTQMPAIFNLSNTSAAEDLEKNAAAIEGITAYLIENSEAIPLQNPPVPGDKEHGAKLVKEIGCLGCHAALDVQASSFGPELSGLGSKTTAAWLYTWLKNPKHYSPDTRMPSLRLSDREAADIAAYLLSLRNESFENRPLPQAKEGVVDEMILEVLTGTLRRIDAQAELERMGRQERLLFLGKKMIAHQGCFGCHQIRGFEDRKPIGTELSNEGKKDLPQLDFGFVPIERTREAWFAQKLRDPRSFDQGKVKGYFEKLRMPQFHLKPEEIQALTTFILSLNEEPIPLEMQKRLDLKEKKIEKGRLLAFKFNCAGCHTLDGEIGALRSVTEDLGAAPPILDGEGAKVQERWLHDFLKNPTTVRPWLSYRMPTFGFTEEELEDWVHYFAYLANQEVSYKGMEPVRASEETLKTGKTLFDQLQCAKCHTVQAGAALGASFLAPDLALTRGRLKPDWVLQWLKDPQTLQSGTMMPSFFPEGQSPLPDILGGDADAQIRAIRDYLYTDLGTG